MKKTIITKISLLVVMVMMLTLVSCVQKGPWSDAKFIEDTELGEGAKTVTVQLTVGVNTVKFTIHTDAETLAAALLENELVEGEDSQYGLYIKKVNGILADYDKNGAYWGFYKDGEYLMSGADSTYIADGDCYEIVYEK